MNATVIDTLRFADRLKNAGALGDELAVATAHRPASPIIAAPHRELGVALTLRAASTHGA